MCRQTANIQDELFTNVLQSQYAAREIGLVRRIEFMRTHPISDHQKSTIFYSHHFCDLFIGIHVIVVEIGSQLFG